MIKALCNKLSRCVNNADLRKMVVVYFCIIQKCKTLEDAVKTHRDVAILLTSEFEDASVAEAKVRLEAKGVGH